MNEPLLLHDLIADTAQRTPHATALLSGGVSMDYAELSAQVAQCSAGLMALGLERQERVAVYLEKRFETVIACFGAAHAGTTFVPVNPLLKAEQVAFILKDCNVRVLVTSPERFSALQGELVHCTDLRHVVLVPSANATAAAAFLQSHYRAIGWHVVMGATVCAGHPVDDADRVAILYTSGSTGKPKGVVLSHSNMVTGAKSVASYLENTATDTLLAALPLSFDAGFSQLTTAFLTGARVVLLNYLMPRDVLKAMKAHQITGLTAVPPLYMQLAQLDWPEGTADTLRYFANTGGHMPLETLTALRKRAPAAKPFLMYGLTEAFRSSYLPPDEVERRPDSIGKAIPHAELRVLRPDGTDCDVDEPGELVHSGPLVSMGYWNRPEQTAERFKPLPGAVGARAVFSGDTVRRDQDGFLYFVGRRDDMIKTSGYRVSPTEVEEALYATGMVSECVAFGIPHEALGNAIQVIAHCAMATGSTAINDLLAACKSRLPSYMVPSGIVLLAEPLPRNANGKLDRKTLIDGWHQRHSDQNSSR